MTRALVRGSVWAAIALAASVTFAAPPTRDEAVRTAKAYAEHEWKADERHARHGADANGVLINTPDREHVGAAGWKPDAKNVGMPYQWGGFDSPAQFDAKIAAGKAAGDIYSAEKRRLGGKAVSWYAAGVDCSGFISRCWQLPQKHSTSTLVSICEQLASTENLKPGDIMNRPGAHVLMFAKWAGDDKARAVFYEAEPFSKVIAAVKDVSALAGAGFQPMRYRKIRE